MKSSSTCTVYSLLSLCLYAGMCISFRTMIVLLFFFYPVQVSQLLNYMLGDEGHGSVAQYLRSQNWASAVSASKYYLTLSDFYHYYQYT